MERLMKWFLPGIVMLATSLLAMPSASALMLRPMSLQPMSLQWSGDAVTADLVGHRGRIRRFGGHGSGPNFSGGGIKLHGSRGGGGYSVGNVRSGRHYSGTFRGYQKRRYYGGNPSGKRYSSKSGSFGGYQKRRYSGDQLVFNGGRYSGGRHYNGKRKHYSRYDPHRHGKRYRYRHDKYRYYYDGYWYLFPWWLGTVTYLDDYPYYDYGDPHVEWCLRRYRSYNPETDMYLGYDGHYHRCISPYSP